MRETSGIERRQNLPYPRQIESRLSIDRSDLWALARYAEAYKVLLDQADRMGAERPETLCGLYLDRLDFIGDRLSTINAQSLDEINAKIRVWKMLAPEDSLRADTPYTDERLLNSAVQDFCRLSEVK